MYADENTKMSGGHVHFTLFSTLEPIQLYVTYSERAK